jgi:serine/threonine protein kinase
VVILTDEQRSIIALGVAAGMQYLRSIGLVHCDLKPENIMLDENFRPKICDFGLTRRKGQADLGGTFTYMAPERPRSVVDFPSDVFAYGLVLFELFTGQAPFPGAVDETQHRMNLLAGKRPEFPKGRELPAPLVNLIQRCWDASPGQRPTFTDIVEQRDQLKMGDSDFHEFDRYWDYLNAPRKGNTARRASGSTR